MDDIFTEEENQDSGNDVEFYLGTVINWSSNSGVTVKLDGQSEAMTKKFKMLLTGRTFTAGERIAVLKHSGTYIVLGAVDKPLTYYNPSDLSSSATKSQIIQRCNLLLTILRNAGIAKNPN